MKNITSVMNCTKLDIRKPRQKLIIQKMLYARLFLSLNKDIIDDYGTETKRAIRTNVRYFNDETTRRLCANREELAKKLIFDEDKKHGFAVYKMFVRGVLWTHMRGGQRKPFVFDKDLKLLKPCDVIVINGESVAI